MIDLDKWADVMKKMYTLGFRGKGSTNLCVIYVPHLFNYSVNKIEIDEASGDNTI